MKCSKITKIIIGIFVIIISSLWIKIQNKGYINEQLIDEEALIKQAIINEHNKDYSHGEEAFCEGHKILQTVEDETQLKIYTIVSIGDYGFENGIFTKVSGTGAIPTVIVFDKDKEGQYKISNYQGPEDGAEYAPSLKRMFPKQLYKKVLHAEEYYEELLKQEEAYAKAYLKGIGRDAKVQGENVEKILDTMNTQASNMLLDRYREYPYWIGTLEKLEDGVRYIYQKDWKEEKNGNGIVTYIKTDEKGNVVEKTVIKVIESNLQYIQRS